MTSSSILPQVHAIGPIATHVVLWRASGAVRLTVVAKATFALVPGREAVLSMPEPVELSSQWLDDDPSRSLRAAIETAPYLPNAGVVLTGHAYAPGGSSVSALSARLAVFSERPLMDKTIHIFGDIPPGGSIPTPFRTMPLVYERCVGGPGVAANPVGMHGAKRANLVDPQQPSRPAGFGPIAPKWPLRRQLFGALEPDTAFQQGVEFPENFDFRALNAAPPDQQIPYLRGDEWIVMDNLSPSEARIETRLPHVRARARRYIHTGESPGAPTDIYLAADTLAIDSDRQMAMLVFRGHFVFERIDMLRATTLFAGLELQNQPLSWPEPDAMPKSQPVQRAASSLIRTADDVGHAPAPAVLPFREASPHSMPQAALPSPKAPPPPANKTPPGDPLMRTVGVSELMAPSFSPVLPFQDKAAVSPPKPSSPPPNTHEIPPQLSQTMGVDALISPFAAKALPFRGGSEQVPVKEPSQPSASLPGAPWSPVPAARVDANDEDRTRVLLNIEALKQTVPQNLPVPVIPPPPARPVPPVEAASPPPGPPLPPAMVAPAIVAPAPPGPPPPAPAQPTREESPIPAPASPAPPSTPSTALDRNAAIAKLGSNLSLDGLDFSNADLSGLDFGGRSLQGTIFRGAKLQAARFSGANMRETIFDSADLSEANFEDAEMAGASLAGADAQRAKFSRAKAHVSNFHRANLTGADLSIGEFESADFSDATLRSALLDQGDFAKARFDRAELANTSFRKARLCSASLVHAHIELTDFRGANLDQASVFGAQLRKAKLAGASMSGLNESEPK